MTLIQHLAGGGLSNPAEQYPSVFGRIQLFKDYPYALPTFATGAIGASAAIINALFLKEVRNVHVGNQPSIADGACLRPYTEKAIMHLQRTRP